MALRLFSTDTAPAPGTADNPSLRLHTQCASPPPALALARVTGRADRCNTFTPRNSMVQPGTRHREGSLGPGPARRVPRQPSEAAATQELRLLPYAQLSLLLASQRVWEPRASVHFDVLCWRSGPSACYSGLPGAAPARAGRSQHAWPALHRSAASRDLFR